jgi:hypothetical protein
MHNPGGFTETTKRIPVVPRTYDHNSATKAQKEARHMPIGKKMDNIKALKDSLKKGGGGTFIKYIPKNDSLTGRFLTEPEEWVGYYEHFDQALRRSYPCIEDNCPGCASEERRTFRYLANFVNTEDDRVIPLQMPKDLANRLVNRYDKYDTLMDRDYELSRSGEGLDTVYDATPEPPASRNLAKYTLHDLEKVLQEAYDSVFNTSAVIEDKEDKPAKKAGGRPKKAAAKVEEPPEGFFPPPKEKVEEVSTDPDPLDEDDDPILPDDDDDTEGDDDSFWTREKLQALALGELKATARDFGVATKGMTASQVIDAILASGSEDDDDDDIMPD